MSTLDVYCSASSWYLGEVVTDWLVPFRPGDLAQVKPGSFPSIWSSPSPASEGTRVVSRLPEKTIILVCGLDPDTVRSIFILVLVDHRIGWVNTRHLVRP